MSARLIPRRAMLRQSAAALAFAALPRRAYEWAAPPLRVALIGTGWYGKSDLFRLMQVAPVQVAALCDVDEHQLAEAAQMIGARAPKMARPKLYRDYRKMLAEVPLDIVLVGTPDHWHTLTAIAAMKAGAHVYLQKPVSVDVIEGESLVAAARKYNRTVQVGTQRRSTPHLVQAKKTIVDAGLLGKVSHAEICCYYPMRNNANPPLQSVPAYFDYDFWSGPAPLRPFDGMPHTSWWRAFMEYGNGVMGDMGVHMFDAVRWMLDLGWPKRISSTGGILQSGGKSNISDTQNAWFEYGDLTVEWAHRTWGTASDEEYPWAFKIYGEKGTLKGDVYKYDFIPVNENEKKIHGDVVYERTQYPEDLTEPRIELHCAPATRAHMRNFLHAIETRTLPVADIEQGHISSASCIQANLSMKLGRPLAYDPTRRIVTGDEEATQLLRRPYRGPWAHPEPDAV